MIGRVWRDLAIEWFDVMVEELDRYFACSFLHELHRAINTGTEAELVDLRHRLELQRIQSERFARMSKDKRPYPHDWDGQWKNQTMFVALCDLALEDF